MRAKIQNTFSGACIIGVIFIIGCIDNNVSYVNSLRHNRRASGAIENSSNMDTANLKYSVSIPEADDLYYEAQQLDKDAGTLPIFKNKNQLRLALKKYNEVIKKYPSSDKIDDAAYNAGVIYEYFKDYSVALLYYKRAFQWDPETPYPTRFRAARILDKNLHQYAEALELYQQAIKVEGQFNKYKEWNLYAKLRSRELIKQGFHLSRETKSSVAQTENAEATSILPNPSTRDNEERETTVFIKSPSVWMPSDRKSLWVLAIGVSKYKNSQVPTLPFARNDAEKVRDWLVKLNIQGFKRDNVHMLFDEQATRENVLSQIDWLRRQALPEDAVFVYFAGHGAPELAPDGTSIDAKYLALYDTDPEQLFATGFPLDDLTLKLDTVKAKTQVVILEACYSGPIGQTILKKTPTADLEIRPRSIQKLGEKGGRVILSASSGSQVAIGSDEIEGGLFTYHLLNAWGDGSQRLLSDQFEEARYQVRRASNRLGSLQEPSKYGDQNMDLVLQVK